jgi:cobalt transporter subunit CbtB
MDVPAAYQSSLSRLFVDCPCRHCVVCCLLQPAITCRVFLENVMTRSVDMHAPAVAQSRPSSLIGKAIPVVVAAGLGLVLLYGAAFAETPALHNAAHDGRHSAGFPCH